jgi:hypothetical protein
MAVFGQAVDAATGFNRRVTEGKLAAKLIAKKAGVATWASIQTMLELQTALKLKASQQLVPLINTHLKKEPYTLAELSSPDCFGVAPNTLFEGLCSHVCVPSKVTDIPVVS